MTMQRDAFTIEIVKDKLNACADEMSVVLARTSMSPIVYEVLDFACGLTDAHGLVVAQTNGLTLFTGTFGPQVESTIEKFGLDGMVPGDIFMTNIPYHGGTHTCDVCLVKPIFFDRQVIAFAVSITHWIEIGGKVPGSISPDATEIYQEGLQFPCVRALRGRPRERGGDGHDQGQRPSAAPGDRRRQRRRRRGRDRRAPSRRGLPALRQRLDPRRVRARSSITGS